MDNAGREVPQSCEDARASPCTDLGQVFTKGDVSNPVEAILNGPVSVHEPEQVPNACVLASEVGDVEAGLDAFAHVIKGRRFSLDDDVGLRVREGDARRYWR